MSPESIKFLNDHRFFSDQLKKEGTIYNIGSAEKEGFLNVIRKDIDPGYMANLYCGQCVAEMIKFIYIQYDKYLVQIHL